MRTNDQDSLKTVLTIIVALLFIQQFTNRYGLVYFTLFIGVGAILSLRFLRFVHLIWTRLSSSLELVIPRIVLTVVFFVCLTPLALLRKLQKAIRSANCGAIKASYFDHVDRRFTKKSFLKTW